MEPDYWTYRQYLVKGALPGNAGADEYSSVTMQAAIRQASGRQEQQGPAGSAYGRQVAGTGAG